MRVQAAIAGSPPVLLQSSQSPWLAPNAGMANSSEHATATQDPKMHDIPPT
jgi:hypothetical protein